MKGSVFGVLGITAFMLGTAAAQRQELPAGPNRDIVSRTCQACHDLSMVFGAAGLSREGWDALLDEMTSYGMQVTPEDRARILDYLASSLGSSPAPGSASGR
jgi:hypothetical protein